MLSFLRSTQSIGVFACLSDSLVMGKPMQGQVAVKGFQSLAAAHLPPIGTGGMALRKDERMLFGSVGAQRNQLSTNWVARPPTQIKPSETRGFQRISATQDGHDSGRVFEYGGTEREKDIMQPEDIIEEIKTLGLHILNPEDPGLTRPKVYYTTKEDAINAIGKYVKKYQDNSEVVTEGLIALRRIMHHDPLANKVGQDVLYPLLLSDGLSDITRNIYLNLVQDAARNSFRKFNIESFMRTEKDILSSSTKALWKILKKDELKEESVVSSMEQVLLERPMLTTLDHWKISIGIFFGLIQKAKRQKIDMFDMLYRFSDPKSLLDGDPLRLLISKEEKIMAEEACKALASQSSVLETRYKLLLTRDARKAFSMSDGEFAGFRAQLEISGPSELREASKALSLKEDPIEVESTLFKLGDSLDNDIGKRNTWTDHFKPSIQLVFYYGKSLIHQDPEHGQSHLYQLVLDVLKSLSDPNAALERRKLVQEALAMLERLSKENGWESSSIRGASYLNQLGPQLFQFQRFIEAALMSYHSPSMNAQTLNILRNTFLEELERYERNPKKMEAVQNLFKPTSQISTDEKYEILDYLKTLVNQPNADLIRDKNVLASQSWRILVILNFAAAGALGPSGKTRYLTHVLEDLEDLTYSTSVVNQRLALISLRSLKGYIHRTAGSVAEKEVKLYI